MATYVASLEEYEHLHDSTPEIVLHEEDTFPKFENKWPDDTFINIDSIDDDKKLGMLLMQKQLLEELGVKNEFTLNKIAKLNTNIEILKCKDIEKNKIKIIQNNILSKHTLEKELTKITNGIEKNREVHEEKLNILATKKKYLRDYLKTINLSINDLKYKLIKKIQRHDMEFIDQIKRLEGVHNDFLVTMKGSTHGLTKLLKPFDEELNNIKNNHSLVVMSLYCQKSILDRESKLGSGQVEEYLNDKNETLRTIDPSTPSNSDENNPTFEDVNYLKNTIGTPILLGLAEIIAKKPHDPIHYLAHWLFAYRYNKDVMEIKKRELDELLIERKHIQDELRKRQAEIDAYDGLIDTLHKMEEEHLIFSILPDQEEEQQPINHQVSDQFSMGNFTK